MIITQTPLRISLLGGNTDFPQFYKKYGGCVLTTAIDKYIYCIVKERFDSKIAISWSKKEIVDSVSEIEHELVRESLKKVGITKGIEINFIGDIPAEGSGLGSSSSVTVGVLNALYNFIGKTPNAEQLAKDAIDIEINKLKKPIGVQDQYIAAFGGLRFFSFSKSGRVDSKILSLPNGSLDDLDNSLMLFYTGITRKSAAVLNHVSKNLNTEVLKKTKRLAEKGREHLERGQPEKVGNLLNEYWQLKKSLSDQISNSQIDKMYSRAISAGAVGGKIAGAGGGGFLVLMVPSEKRKHVRKVLRNYLEVPFRLEKDGSKVIFNVRKY